MIRDVHPGSESWYFTHPGSRGQKGTGSASLRPLRIILKFGTKTHFSEITITCWAGPARCLYGVLQARRLRAGHLRGRDGHPGGAWGHPLRHRVLSAERTARLRDIHLSLPRTLHVGPRHQLQVIMYWYISYFVFYLWQCLRSVTFWCGSDLRIRTSDFWITYPQAHYLHFFPS